ncbi:rust resistance kinase Lr10-like [Canna indica]|uniref:Rust resistance kinase Lr10-like n=1 Tax=Canna indica TaxID=4628 RepID=A0AAQ3JWG3_9LILI|nr:rust resistance kinase Lr10-like [Canna indica]
MLPLILLPIFFGDTASVVVAGIVVIIMFKLILRFIRETRMQSINSSIATQSEAAPMSYSMSNHTKIEIEPIERFINNILKEKPVRFTPQNILDFTQNYAMKLGSGGYGVVYKGQFPNGIQVAVKVLNKTSGEKAEEQFMAEVGIMSRTYHINLVKLYGFCFDKSVKALVYEYMEKGSLDKYLYSQAQALEWEKLHVIATGTAKGIRYLHEECEQKIVHYDIKPANVLLTAELFPKAADFGLACLCDRKVSHGTPTGVRGTPGFAAPEMWTSVLPNKNEKCDVYSFGMLLFEILGRRKNLDFKQDNESREWFPQWVWNKFEQGEMESIISLCGVESKDRAKAERMCQVALWCIQYQPDARPSMTGVVRMLEGEQEIVPPVNPFYYISSTEADSKMVSTTDSSSSFNVKDNCETYSQSG